MGNQFFVFFSKTVSPTNKSYKTDPTTLGSLYPMSTFSTSDRWSHLREISFSCFLENGKSCGQKLNGPSLSWGRSIRSGFPIQNFPRGGISPPSCPPLERGDRFYHEGVLENYVYTPPKAAQKTLFSCFAKESTGFDTF